mmetsp:Transcript_23360/g.43394  ORF Transcript_23360/g.43394 Transcript_23360/m.43394 type:complete len:114 (-) Transcript_23360:309-650(-)
MTGVCRCDDDNINYDQIDDSEEFFILRAMGDLRPRVLDAVLSDFSVSFAFFPFFPPKRPPKIPFFFFLVSPLSTAGAETGFGFKDVERADVDGVVGGSSTSCPVFVVSTFITR